MDPVAVSALACPHCRSPLSQVEHALRCAEGHSFDISRHGYANLIPGGARVPTTGDTASMVVARQRFLTAGHFDPLATAVTALLVGSLDARSAGVVADVGAGTGWLLAHILDALPEHAGVALDASKHAARRGAVAHPRAAAIVCDAWAMLPLVDDSASLVVSFFAPRNPAEFERIVVPGGLLVVITPAPDHLTELGELLQLITIDPRKDKRLDEAFEHGWQIRSSTAFRATMTLGPPGLSDIVAMGPSAHHVSSRALQHALDSVHGALSVTSAFNIRLLARDT